MEFTGERYIPDVASDGEIVAEHLQRYLSVTELVKGKIVVDAASGAGYGSHLLAEVASSVVGVDLSLDAVSFATRTYCLDNLKYLQGSIDVLPFADKSVDVVVSFETIEHVGEKVQEAFLYEVRRVLKEDGLLVISSPDKEIYSDRTGYCNEFHEKEFYRDEFKGFLSTYFKNIALCDQFEVLSYVLCHEESSTLDVLELDSRRGYRGKYNIALCSNFDIDPMLIPGTVIIDREGAHQQKVDRVVELQGEIFEKNKVITWLEGVVDKEKNNAVYQDNVIGEKTGIIEELQKQVGQLQIEFKESQILQKKGEKRVASLAEKLDHIHSTNAWKIIRKIYWLKNKLWPL